MPLLDGSIGFNVAIGANLIFFVDLYIKLLDKLKTSVAIQIPDIFFTIPTKAFIIKLKGRSSK